MHVSAEHLEIAAKLDAKVQRLLGLGYDDLAIFVEMADDMPDSKRQLDTGQLLMDELCRRFAGFYRYAKILEQIAAGIASGEIHLTEVFGPLWLAPGHCKRRSGHRLDPRKQLTAHHGSRHRSLN